MYEERKEKFSFQSFFLTLLLVLLFVFLMLWLFPTKSYVDEKLQSTYDLERLEVLYDEIFANNVARMKDAAIGYFTNERMPKTVGETKKLTLGEMYDLHLVLKIKDKDGKPCDTLKSYVEMTKYTEEYRLKVNLSCGSQEDYIIVYLGCYNYCSSGICEKRIPTPSQTTAKEESKKESTSSKPTPENPTPDKPTPDKPTPEKPTPDKPTPEKPKTGNIKVIKKNSTTKKVISGAGFTLYKGSNCTGTVVKSEVKTNSSGVITFSGLNEGTYYVKESTVPTNYQKPSNVCTTVKVKAGERTSKTIYNTPKPATKNYLYEYKLVVKDTKTCGNWTKWSKTKVTASDLVKVETKKVEEITGYKTVKVPVTKTETVTKKVTEKYISKYVTELVLVGTKEVQVGTTTKTVTEKVKVGTVEVDTGKIGTGTKVPKNTSTNVYKVISEDTPKNCSYCENKTTYTWRIYNVEPVYEVRTVKKQVPVYKTINVYESKEVPVYDFRTVEKKEKVTKTTYVEKKVEQYETVTYYRSQTCKIKKGYTDIKWSKTKTDTDLISKGYKLTGNVKEA